MITRVALSEALRRVVHCARRISRRYCWNQLRAHGHSSEPGCAVQKGQTSVEALLVPVPGWHLGLPAAGLQPEGGAALRARSGRHSAQGVGLPGGVARGGPRHAALLSVQGGRVLGALRDQVGRAVGEHEGGADALHERGHHPPARAGRV